MNCLGFALARCPRLLRQSESREPVDNPEVHHLGLAAMVSVDHQRRHAEDLRSGEGVDVVAAAVRPRPAADLSRSAPAAAARSANSRRPAATWPGSAVNAARISRPSSVRMGMFCRLGLVDDSRPVAVPVWSKVVCSAPGVRIDQQPAARPRKWFELGELAVFQHQARQLRASLPVLPAHRPRSKWSCPCRTSPAWADSSG